jgi:hypothetical protein
MPHTGEAPGEAKWRSLRHPGKQADAQSEPPLRSAALAYAAKVQSETPLAASPIKLRGRPVPIGKLERTGADECKLRPIAYPLIRDLSPGLQ